MGFGVILGLSGAGLGDEDMIFDGHLKHLLEPKSRPYLLKTKDSQWSYIYIAKVSTPSLESTPYHYVGIMV